MKNKIFRKIMVCAILISFLGLSTVPLAGSISTKIDILKNTDTNFMEPPVIKDAYWELTGSNSQGWIVTFYVDCYDETSGMNRVEYELGDELMYTDFGPTPPYIWILENPFDIEDWENKIIRITAYDNAGNSDFVIFECSEIKSKSCVRIFYQIFPNHPIFQILIQLLKF